MTEWEATGRVREMKPNCSGDSARGFVNKRIRNVVDMRQWADLLRLGTIAIPQAYTAGTITLTPGSNIVIGAGTNWQPDDAISTSITEAIVDTGVVEVAAADMSGIAQGMYLRLEPENSSTAETILVLQTMADRFLASVRYQHAIGATVIASSLANLQFRAPYPVFTVKSVRSFTELELDANFGGPAYTNVAYQIYLGYVTIDPLIRRLFNAWDPVQGQPIGTYRTVDWLNLCDPQRTSSNDPQELVSTAPAPGGLMQWEIWPPQMSPRTLNVVYYAGWPALNGPNDMLPPFINPEIIISGAIADALRQRVIAREGRTDPFFDPQLAMTYEQEFANLVENGIQRDDGRFMRALQSYNEQLGISSDYLRSHLGPPGQNWPSDFGG